MNKLVKIIEAERRDTDEARTALRLQATAWRLLAIIACHDPAYAKEKIRWLLFVTVPFVARAVVEEFIVEHESIAKDYGEKAGIFR